MAIGYTLRTAGRVAKALRRHPDRLNLQLAALCIQHDVPIAEVAEYLKVSRQTVHSWFNDQYRISEDKVSSVEALITKLKKHYESEASK